MNVSEHPDARRIPLSRSQQNIYNGVLQDADPDLYLIGRSYRFDPIPATEFLAAVRKTILANPIQLCVLAMPTDTGGYPELVARLGVEDIVSVDRDGAPALAWRSGILETPLVRYHVRTDDTGLVRGLDVHAHHILLDGGAIGIMEAGLGRALGDGAAADFSGIGAGLADVTRAHRREANRIDESLDRLTAVVQRELSDDAELGRHADGPHALAAARGIRVGSVAIVGEDFDDILGLADREGVALNVLVAAAAIAVDARARQATENLLVHAVDNRFGEPELAAATCLVNSIAQPVRFPAYASVADVVRTVDRGYVKAGRRRWLREERYRRMYLATHRTTAVEALTLNFVREPCAPELRPFLADVPLTTEIGPVEGMTVAAILDERRRTLTLDIWNRDDVPQEDTAEVADRVASALTAIPAMWESPIAMIVDDWFGIAEDGCRLSVLRAPAEDAAARAWFLHRDDCISELRRHRRHVDPWISRLLQIGAVPGDVLLFTDDNTDRTIDLMIACHLAGCGYSVCDIDDELQPRAERIIDHGAGISARIVDTAAAVLSDGLDEESRRLVDVRIGQVAGDPLLAARTAYVMPTSGSTGEPKLVQVGHAALAAFCAAQVRAYGWNSGDTILQCAPLTSDISVEEVFGAALSGATLVRSTAVKTGDLQALTLDVVMTGSSVVDLPTAVWQLWGEDREATAAVRGSRLRQIVIGGEPVRPGAVDRWLDTAGAQHVSLVSSYGPTETTVVVTYLPLIDGGTATEPGARVRLGRPLVPDTVAIAFGEVVVVGEMVADGYLGVDNSSFGSVTLGGVRRRAFATADRITVDDAGYPVFAGRKDAIVKIAGQRVDTAEITRRIAADPDVVDVAVRRQNGSLGVWFSTRDGGPDYAASARVKRLLAEARVPSFVVSTVPDIPRTPNGKLDTARLRAMDGPEPAGHVNTGSGEQATGLARMWSRLLGRSITPDASLWHEGVGSLDLVRILPETRSFLGREVSILDVISADTALNLVRDIAVADRWMDAGTAAEIDRDFAAAITRRTDNTSNAGRSTARHGPILVIGASGILGTGFASAIGGLRGVGRPDVVLAMRSVPSAGVWAALRGAPGVSIEQLTPGFGAGELATLIRGTGAGTLVNCIGNTNVVVPYRELRSANVELVAAMVQACVDTGTSLVHLSTYVVNANVRAPQVLDPRQAPYPYAASKALAELEVAGSPAELDFTIVRLPRVLGEPGQMAGSTDILMSVVDACRALQAYPSVELSENVTTGRAAATSVLRRLPEFGGPDRLGRRLDVLCGQTVSYPELLGAVAREPVDAPEWKRRLDESDWARANPRRWSVIDAWISLGVKLGGRSYPQYLAEYPALPLDIESVGELVAATPPIQSLIAKIGTAGTDCGSGPTNRQKAARQ
ncbi:AMP-binding protein [Mycolicibacterium sp. HK-90]|uniref:AMP-binding protein n=1 Tax=Mycolicibacterium sp. HK-90 TaxID=3056937 RepID=UPI002659E88A|nr:AMP-binding protein [Mycolicibacterium sp. HK-90]WKG01705.1 AMP-binding protein [Mycolicibacterium sp. HK-90]